MDFETFLAQSGGILDGGLASALEASGHDLDDPLWSARVLIDDPDAIGRVHDSYFAAGADVATTATYQASFPGMIKQGLKAVQVTHHLLRAVAIACQARERRRDVVGGDRPLFVAASIGTYGAYLADGSEFRGDWHLDEESLIGFHRPRVAVLANSDADVLAFETMPRIDEVRAMVRLLRDFPFAKAWMSFAMRDGSHLNSGERIEDAVDAVVDSNQIVAIGVNCTSPGFIAEAIDRIRGRSGGKPIIVYPNSGESFMKGTGWAGNVTIDEWVTRAVSWRRSGASLVGGCCRVTPDHIAALASAFPRA